MSCNTPFDMVFYSQLCGDACKLTNVESCNALKYSGRSLSLSDLSANADLYLKLGEAASDSSADCQSENAATTAESCVLLVPANAVLHMAVRGVESATYTITASAEDTAGVGGEVAADSNTADSVETSGMTHYTLTPSTEEREVTVTLSDLNADANLYLKLGAPASDTVSDCLSESVATADESCVLIVPANAVLHLAVHGVAATTYTLNVSAEDTVTGVGGEVTADSSTNDAVQSGAWTRFTLTPSDAEREVTVALSALTTDANLYLLLGEQASDGQFDCASEIAVGCR